jgi:hypothetical protein
VRWRRGERYPPGPRTRASLLGGGAEPTPCPVLRALMSECTHPELDSLSRADPPSPLRKVRSPTQAQAQAPLPHHAPSPTSVLRAEGTPRGGGSDMDVLLSRAEASAQSPSLRQRHTRRELPHSPAAAATSQFQQNLRKGRERLLKWVEPEEQVGGLAKRAYGYSLGDHTRHVNQCTLNLRPFSYTSPYDVASSIRPALRRG